MAVKRHSRPRCLHRVHSVILTLSYCLCGVLNVLPGHVRFSWTTVHWVLGKNGPCTPAPPNSHIGPTCYRVKYHCKLCISFIHLHQHPFPLLSEVHQITLFSLFYFIKLMLPDANPPHWGQKPWLLPVVLRFGYLRIQTLIEDPLWY